MNIIVLAGGADQIALINELKKRRHRIILIDYFEDPIAKPYSDIHYQESTLDDVKVKQIAIKEKADMICTACTDQALLTVAKVSEELNLPCYLSYKTALNVTNKSYMKDTMINGNIPTAKYIITDCYRPNIISNLDFPLVVKPVDCNSSKGVTKVYDHNALKKAIIEDIQLSRTRTVIVEEFKTGEEISADFYIEGNNAKFLCATKSKKIKNTNSFTIVQSYYPALTTEEEKKITHIANKIATVFELKDCPLLIQCIQSVDSFYIIEFSARMGGGSKYKLIEYISGINIMQTYVDRILGERPSITPIKNVSYATMNYVYSQNGTFRCIKGQENLLEKGIINEFFQYQKDGTTNNKHNTSSDRPCGYLVIANSEEEMEQKIIIADNSLRIIDENENDMMIHNLLNK
ncbi:acetyl-CoA carboxylase biotin carboxylase subunit family protein [Prevotella sp. HUN102]|uniref:ATP-grasp domain-containing protein n=1 Tax=Prevotella sp. HUN102 TaxID=1392486 RepID=UPI00056CA31D|nr:ATP-grasp domain-containing protein [Prevotella sp. HUN102]